MLFLYFTKRIITTANKLRLTYDRYFKYFVVIMLINFINIIIWSQYYLKKYLIDTWLSLKSKYEENDI